MATHDDRMAKLPKARKERIEKRAKELHREYRAIRHIEHIPNSETLEAMEESRQGKGMKFSSVEELLACLDDEDSAIAAERLKTPGKRYAMDEVKDMLNIKK